MWKGLTPGEHPSIQVIIVLQNLGLQNKGINLNMESLTDRILLMSDLI